LRDGDIIAFTTSIKGLDIGHVGIAVREEDGRIHILHAPQPGTKVHITKEPLSEYIMSVKKHSGIIILRAEELKVRLPASIYRKPIDPALYYP